MRLAALILLSVASCHAEHEPEVTEPRIYTASYPTTYLTERIVGDLLEVTCPVAEGDDPASWQPSPEVLALYQTARLIVFNGAGFERWRDHASLPLNRVVDTAQAFQGDWIVRRTGAVHSHGDGSNHRHSGPDGHTWMDPLLAKKQAQVILEAVSHLGPTKTKQNFIALAKDLDKLHARLRELTPKLSKVQLLCSHAAYDYIARRHRFQVIDLDIDPAKGLNDAHRKALTALPPATKRLLLWESEPAQATVAELREKWRVDSVVYSPCEVLTADQRARGDDWLSLMKANLDRLARAASN